jgi:hypothetical protein
MLPMSSSSYRNIHGRKWGRGLRPYLLLPKVILVGIFLGGIVSVLMLAFLEPPPGTHPEWTRHARLIQSMYIRVIVPALVGTLVTGILLSLSHLRAFLRMRWFQLKLALIVAFVPALHVIMRERSLALRAALAEPEDLAAAAVLRTHMMWGTLVVLLFALVVILLGRIKPRLGQDYGRTFARPPAPDPARPDETAGEP